MLTKLVKKINNQELRSFVEPFDHLCMTLIGVVSLGYCAFGSWFAELNIQFSFLNFPIFIGEILLFVFLCFLFAKWRSNGWKVAAWGYVLSLYLGFVLLKAGFGYFEWGPLALRHAALFHYPLFAVSGYFFFRKEYFTVQKAMVLILIFGLLLLVDTKLLVIVQYTRMVCVLLMFVFACFLVKDRTRLGIRWFLVALLFTIASFELLFRGQRAMTMGNMVSACFLAITIPFIVKEKKFFSFWLPILAIPVVVLGVLAFSDKTALRSLTSFQDNVEWYKKYSEKIAVREPFFKMRPIEEVRVYNKNKTLNEQKNQGLMSTEERRQMYKQQMNEVNRELTEIDGRLEKVLPKTLGSETKLMLDSANSSDNSEIASPPSVTRNDVVVRGKKTDEAIPNSNQAGAPRSVKAGVRAGSSSEVAGRAKPEAVDFSAPPVKAGVSTLNLTNSVLAEEEQLVLPVMVTKGAIGNKEKVPPDEKEEVLTDEKKGVSPDKKEDASPDKKEEVSPDKKEEASPDEKEEVLTDEKAKVDKKQVMALFDKQRMLELQRHALSEEIRLSIGGFAMVHRDEEATFNNSLFRIFIWQDMIEDLWKEKPIWGFDFGKPFRSKKIEILRIAEGEWSTVGWMATHNSYLEVLYRAGAVGIFYLALLFSLFFRMVYLSLSARSVVGLLICGAVLNWLVVTNFVLFLELPYHAIPFWSLFGMSFAYLKKTP